MKKVTQAQLKMMGDMGGAMYARQEAWDIQQAASALQFIAAMVMDEADEPADVQSLANIMRSLMEFIGGEIADMVSAAKQGEGKSANLNIYDANGNTITTSTVTATKWIEPSGGSVTISFPAEPKEQPLNLDYVKSLGIGNVPDLAAKFVAKDQIKGYAVLWGDADRVDLEREYFTKDTNFWNNKPQWLTWDHAQDEQFKSDPRVGEIMEVGDDEWGKWYVAKLKKAEAYRKYLDDLIARKAVGSSSDSAPQYVKRVRTGKSIWLAEWPLFAVSLTDNPCEPRMIGSLEFLKSLGITLPDMPSETWEADLANIEFLKIKYFE